MGRRIKKPTGKVAEALALVSAGKLFELQKWIVAGEPYHGQGFEECELSCLYRACQIGFHSMVELLLKAGGWTEYETGAAIQLAMASKRIDLVELLLDHGAPASAIDFADVCRSMDVEMMGQYLKLGVDPSSDNAFARALDSMKARPLLRFYRTFRTEFPALHRQVSLALTVAVKERKALRWIVLLKWAGADPMMRVPTSLYGEWDGENETHSAVEEALGSCDLELLKTLGVDLKSFPPADLAESLSNAVWEPSPKMVAHLLPLVPLSVLNGDERGLCPHVTDLLEMVPFFWRTPSQLVQDQENMAALDCLKLLLRSGARWTASDSEIAIVRIRMLKRDPRHVVNLIKALLEAPSAAVAPRVVIELCRTPKMRETIGRTDPPLCTRLDSLRGEKRERWIR